MLENFSQTEREQVERYLSLHKDATASQVAYVLNISIKKVIKIRHSFWAEEIGYQVLNRWRWFPITGLFLYFSGLYRWLRGDFKDTKANIDEPPADPFLY